MNKITNKGMKPIQLKPPRCKSSAHTQPSTNTQGCFGCLLRTAQDQSLPLSVHLCDRRVYVWCTVYSNRKFRIFRFLGFIVLYSFEYCCSSSWCCGEYVLFRFQHFRCFKLGIVFFSHYFDK